MPGLQDASTAAPLTGVLVESLKYCLAVSDTRSVTSSPRTAAPGASLVDALEHLQYGTVLVDADQRIITASDALLRAFAVPSGTPVRDQRFIEVAASGGAQLVQPAGARPALWRLPDGRAVQLDVAPVAGGGWWGISRDATTSTSAGAGADEGRRDSLTGLSDRASFHARVDLHLRQPDPEVAVLSLDLDHFKNVNDTLGHPAGDQLLQQVAMRLREAVRAGDTIGRLGGDEFAIVQTGAAQPAAAVALARRVIQAVSQPYEIDSRRVDIGTSIGIAIAPWDGADTDELLQHSDLALYRAKHDGRGRHRLYEPVMSQDVRARRDLEQDLRQALREDLLELHYQPLVDAGSRAVVGLEALLRWTHPVRGAIGPADFIPVAEQSGLILDLGRWVLRRACRDAATWPVPVPVAVNVSPAQLHKKTLVPDVTAALAASGLPASRLELEITEGVLISNTEYTLRALTELKARGVRVSMDDFGTGYSSLSYLRTFPFDKLKIDRSFVQGAEDDGDSAAIIRAVASLGHTLGMTTVAEGVETDAQLAALQREGCHQIQGYLISRPQPAAAIAQMLQAPVPPVALQD